MGAESKKRVALDYFIFLFIFQGVNAFIKPEMI